MNHQFSEPVDIHATYLSLYVYTGLVACLHYFPLKGRWKVKLLYIFGSVVLAAGLVQLGSRAVMTAFLLTCLLAFPMQIGKERRLKYFLVAITSIAIIAVLVLNVESFRTRFLEQLSEDLQANETVHTTDSRMERWAVVLDLVKASPVIGYGTGDEVDILKEQYFSHKLYDAYLNKLNAHNQYLSFLLTGGVIGLAIFLVTLAWGLNLAIRARNVIFLGFMILLICVSVSENFLYRNKGIFFYAFVFSYFVLTRTDKTWRQNLAPLIKRGNLQKAEYVFTNEH